MMIIDIKEFRVILLTLLALLPLVRAQEYYYDADAAANFVKDVSESTTLTRSVPPTTPETTPEKTTINTTSSGCNTCCKCNCAITKH